MRIGRREFDTHNGCYIMGILNVTPDSFSDGGRHGSVAAALEHARLMASEGADIIDVGGESTRPGHVPVPESEELERVIPVVEALRRELDVPISVDTYKSSVAEAALRAGADMINDVWGFRRDTRMASVVAAHGAACCLMHNRERAEYSDFMPELLSDLAESARIAREAGVAEDRIVLDPGIGFAKSPEQNLTAMNRLGELRSLGYPVLLGVSRKSVIGLALGLPVAERLEGTIAASVLGFLRGAAFLRVHDVRANLRAVRMARAIVSEAL